MIVEDGTWRVDNGETYQRWWTKSGRCLSRCVRRNQTLRGPLVSRAFGLINYARKCIRRVWRILFHSQNKKSWSSGANACLCWAPLIFFVTTLLEERLLVLAGKAIFNVTDKSTCGFQAMNVPVGSPFEAVAFHATRRFWQSCRHTEFQSTTSSQGMLCTCTNKIYSIYSK